MPKKKKKRSPSTWWRGRRGALPGGRHEAAHTTPADAQSCQARDEPSTKAHSLALDSPFIAELQRSYAPLPKS